MTSYINVSWSTGLWMNEYNVSNPWLHFSNCVGRVICEACLETDCDEYATLGARQLGRAAT
jgi:hypothetical protein